MESFKHFNAAEAPTKDEKLKKPSLAELQDQFRTEDPKGFAFFESLVDKIRLDVLEDIFSEYRTRSGLSKQNFSLHPRKRVRIYNDEKDGGHGICLPTEIGLNINAISKEIDKKNTLIPLYHTLVHEYTHAASGVEDWQSTEEGKQVHYVRSGVSERRSLEGEEIRSHADLFNEGLTEHIAHEVLLEYARRTGELPDRKKILDNATSEMLEDTGYSHAQRFADLFVRSFAETTGVPPEVVWRGLERAYFERSPILKELSGSLSELVGEDLAHTVETSEDKDHLFNYKLIQYLDRNPDLIEKWTQQLDATRGAR